MQVFKFQTQVKCGAYQVKNILGKQSLTAYIDDLEENTVHAFSGENGELLARIFCNINCDNYEEIEDFYKKYGHLYSLNNFRQKHGSRYNHPVYKHPLDGEPDIIIPLADIVEEQLYISKILDFSAAIQETRDTKDGNKMLCEMFYFVLFSELGWKSSRSKMRTEKHETGILALQNRFALELRDGKTIESALCAILYEYEMFQKGTGLESADFYGLNATDLQVLEAWRRFAETGLCKDICETLKNLPEDQCVSNGKELHSVSKIEYDEDNRAVKLSGLPHHYDIIDGKKLAQRVLCEVLNRDLWDIKWEITIDDRGRCKRITTLPNLHALMISEISQAVIDKKSIAPVECNAIGCKKVFSRYIRGNRKFCSITCKNREMVKAYRKREKQKKLEASEEKSSENEENKI